MRAPDPPKDPQLGEKTPPAGPPTLDYQTPHPHKTWKCGTLTYTKWGLVSIFIWMLWGELIFKLVEEVFPMSMPFQLERLQYPKAYIAVTMGTISQIIHLTMVPYLSFRSDRTRTRWGRRIPYIVSTMIPLVLCLAALGFSDDIGAYIRTTGGLARFGITPLWTIIIVMGILIVLFDFFNAFVQTVYWYLFADTIPSELIGRFNALFRMVGISGGAFFAYFIRAYIESHTKYIYCGAALLYLFGFSLMCWRVRESEYPPPKDEGPRAAWYVRLARSVKIYCRECYTHPVFICLYAYSALWQLGNACMIFTGFFYIRYLHFTQEQVGHFHAGLAVVPFLLALPQGWLVDKLHPIRVVVMGAACVIPISFAGAYMNSFLYYMIFFALRVPFMSLFDAAGMPLQVKLFPKKQYGQFSSAGGLIRTLAMLFGTILGGYFIGYFDRRIGTKACAMAWTWMGIFQTLGFGCLLVTYLYWKKHGAERFAYDAEKRTVVLLPETASAAAANPPANVAKT